MNRKAAVRQFSRTAEVNDATAIKYLSRNSYDVNHALNDYYAAGGAEGALPSRADKTSQAAQSIMSAYVQGGSKDIMLADDVERFCKALGIEPVDPAILVFCHACRCSKMGEFTLDEMCRGCREFSVCDLSDLNGSVAKWREILTDAEALRGVYRWIFGYILEPGTKVLPGDVAVDYWKLLLPPLGFHYTDAWLEFAERKLCGEEVRSVPCDVWNTVYDFLKVTCPSHIAAFDVNESIWPTIIDEFVMSLRHTA